MKNKLTLSVERELIQRAKHIAQAQKTSISSLVETFLSNLVLKRRQSFSEKWRGAFKQTPQIRPSAIHQRSNGRTFG